MHQLAINFDVVRFQQVKNLKAFLVNRVGDFGFILGIAGIVTFTNSLDYATVFASAPDIASESVSVFWGDGWNAITLICILLFIGAMGKSAQAPLDRKSVV